MNEENTELISSRRAFLGVDAAVFVASSIGSNSKPAEEATKTQPGEGAGAAPNGPTKPAKAINGTAPNAALSKEYVRMVGRFAYLWGGRW